MTNCLEKSLFLYFCGCDSVMETNEDDKNAHKSVIKPIAFKPVVPNRYVSNPGASPPFQHSPPRTTPPKQSFEMRMSNHSQDDGYASQEYNSGTHSHSTSNISQGSLHIDTTERPPSYHSDSHRLCERPDSYNSSLLSHHSGNHIDGFMQTPSPSDSGVVEEAGAMLREKDAEIHNLRETMEHNETVIFKVYKEKEQNWEMEYRDLHAQWEQKLKQQQQKSFKMEQALLLQLFKLQQERKNLRLDIEQMRNSKDQMQHKYESADEDLRQTKLKLEEIQWDLCQKTGEISLLKSQLKDSKDETSTKANDMLGLKSQLRDLQTETLERHAEVQRLQSELKRARDEYLTAKKELDQAKDKIKQGCARATQTESHSQTDTQSSSHEISAEKSQGLTSTKPNGTSSSTEDLKAEMEKIKRQSVADREQWLEEKNKVIRYQKHLQLNYVQMVNKNKLLEAEVEQLTLELENRDLQLGTQSNGMMDDLPEGQESTC